MSQADTDADKIPTLTDLVQPGTESKPRPAPEPEPEEVQNEAQLDMPLDAPAGETESFQTYGDESEAAIAEAENLLGREDEALTGEHAAGAVIDIPALLDALEPRIEALVDEALDRQARQARDEIVSSVMQSLREEFAPDAPADTSSED